MFDIELLAALAKVTLRVEDHEGQLLRRMRLALDREFDDELAAGIGKGAQKALKLLVAKDVQKCTIGLDAVEANADLVATRSDRVALKQERIAIGQLRGVLATCAAPKEAGDVTHIRLEFEAPYSDDVWAFLGRHCGAYVQITFTRRQLELQGAA